MPNERLRFEKKDMWLDQELEHGVVAAYRFIEQDGTLVVAEIRVSAETTPWGGLPARSVRRVTTAGAVTAATARLEQQRKRAPGATRERLAERGFIDVARESDRSTGRRGHSDGFYLEIAQAYVAGCRAGAPSPAQHVADMMAGQGIAYSVATVTDLIREARRRGFLTEAPPGRAGGALTERAKELQEQRRKDKSYNTRRAQWVEMYHPDIEGTAKVTRLAFDEVWAEKGWLLSPKEKRGGSK